jgi:hypothetical protein
MNRNKMSDLQTIANLEDGISLQSVGFQIQMVDLVTHRAGGSQASSGTD